MHEFRILEGFEIHRLRTLMLIPEQKKPFQGLFLRQKEENICFSRTLSFIINDNKTSPFFFVLCSPSWHSFVFGTTAV